MSLHVFLFLSSLHFSPFMSFEDLCRKPLIAFPIGSLTFCHSLTNLSFLRGILFAFPWVYKKFHSETYVSKFKKDLPGGSAGKESACNMRDLGSIPGLGRSPGEQNSYPLQYSDLENSMDCIVHGVSKSWTWLSKAPSLKFKIYTYPKHWLAHTLALSISSLCKILVAAVWRINWRKERPEVTAMVIWVMMMGPKKWMDSGVIQNMNGEGWGSEEERGI